MTITSKPLLESLVIDAVRRFGGTDDGMFNSAAFAVAACEWFGLAGVPDGGWCARVLRGLPYVVPLPHGCHWLYRPGQGAYCPS